MQIVRRPGFLLRAAVSVAGAVALALVVSYIYLLATGRLHIEQLDFVVYYCTGGLVVHGHGGAVYDMVRLRAAETAVLHGTGLIRSEAGFLYPPFAALVFAPLGALPYGAAYVLWLAVNAVLLCLTLAAGIRYLQLSRSGSILISACTIAFLPVFDALAQGQVSIVLLALLTTALLNLRRGRDGLAGLLLAGLLVKPPLLLPIIVVLMLQRRLRSVAVCAATCAALLIAPIPVLGWRSDGQFINLMLQAMHWHNHSGGFAPETNHNISAFMHLLLPGSAGTALGLVLCVLVLGACALAALGTAELELPFALGVVASLLVNPHVLMHDLSLLVLPVLIALRYRTVGPAHLGRLLAVGYVAILLGFRLVTIVPVQLSVVAMIALGAWLFLATGARLPEWRRFSPSRGTTPRSSVPSR